MVPLLLFLLFIALLFGAGFAVDLLWVAAVLALGVWLLGFLVRGAERTWYHW